VSDEEPAPEHAATGGKKDSTSARWQLDRGRLFELMLADVVLAFLISGIVLAFHIWIDDRREEREVRRDDLRFAREVAILDPVSKALADADLSGENLTALNLSDAILFDADLRGANLDTANVRH
jgi:uncharacterized protein YjbI with pentapeptide repeats